MKRFCVGCLVLCVSVVSEDVCDSYESGAVGNLQTILGGSSDVASADEALQGGIGEVNAQAGALIDTLKGFRGDNTLLGLINSTNITKLMENPDPTGGPLYDYVEGIVMISAPGFGLLALALICCPFMCIARCCCTRRCCKPKKPMGEYSTRQLLWPVGNYLFLAVNATAFAFLAVSNIGTMVDGIFATLCELSDLLLSLVDFIMSLTDPLLALLTSVDVIVDHVAGLSTGLDLIGESATALNNTLISSIDFFDATVNTLSGLSIAVSLTDLQSIQASLVSGQAELEDSVSANLEAFQASAQSFDLTDTTSIFDMLLNVTGSLNETVRGIANSTEENVLAPVKADLSSQLETLTMGSYLMYFTVFLSLVTGLFAILTYLTPMKCDDAMASRLLGLSSGLTYIFMILMFLNFAIYLPIALIFSDVCDLIYVAPYDLDGLLAIGGLASDEANATNSSEGGLLMDPVGLLGGCFTQNFSSILNKTGFDFEGTANTIDTDIISNISTFDTDPLIAIVNSAVNSISGLDLSNVGTNQSSIDDAMAALNTFATNGGSSNTYTQAECTITSSCARSCIETTSCAPQTDVADSNLHANLQTLRNTAIDTVISVETINATNLFVQTADTKLLTTSGALFANVSDTLAMVGDIVLEAESIKGVILGLESAGDCAFLGKTYYALHGHICNTTLNALLMVAVFNLLIGLAACPLVCFGISINVRLFGVGASKKSATVFTE